MRSMPHRRPRVARNVAGLIFFMSSIPPATTHLEATSAPGQQLEKPISRWTGLKWLARGLFGLLLTLWSLLLIAWLTLHWGILPHIQQWRGPIEMRASAALGVPVRIGSIEVRSRGWVPSFDLREVVLLDAARRPALRLPHVFAAISPRSLFSLKLQFHQLLIDGAQLDVRRAPDGHIVVAGLDFSGPGSGDGGSAAADWFFSQSEFVIRGGSLRWTDEQRQAPPLMLDGVQIVVRNGLRRHDIRLDATPPSAWGDRFQAIGRFTQPILARRGDWQRWSGTAYADLPRADVHALRQYATLPFELSEGVGALRGWFDVRGGEPVSATVDVALREVAMRLDRTVDPLVIRELEGRLVGQRDSGGLSLALQHFTFETGDDIRWPQGDMKLTWRQRAGQAVSGGAFSAQRLDIGLMAQVASRVPLGDALRRLLAQAAPKGLVSGLDASWDGPLDAPTHYRVKGRVEALTLAAQPAADPREPGRPGVRGADAWFDLRESGGNARVAINGGAIELPGVFDDPLLVLDQLGAQLVWALEPGAGAAQPSRLNLQVKEAHFANTDASGDVTATWREGSGNAVGRGGRFPGSLELDAKLAQARAERIPRYLPLGMPQQVRDYLGQAIQAGRIENASFHVKGDLWDFPYFNNKPAATRFSVRNGDFRISARIADGAFAFVPGTASAPSPWPALAHASADLTVEHGTLELRNASTQLGKVAFQNVQATITGLDAEPVLSLAGEARGPLSDMLNVVNTSPIDGWIANALANASVTGLADLTLGLSIPLQKVESASVKGSVRLAGNDLRMSAESPLLGGAKGRVDFTNQGFAVVGASARLYGGDASFEGGSQPDGSVRFKGQGSVSAEGLRRATELGGLARMASVLSGQAAYRASLGFVRGRPELDISSNLVGLAIDLPAPLGKAPDAPLALHVSSAIDASTPTAMRDTLKFELGDLVQASYLRDLGGAEPRVLRGGIGVKAPLPEPAAGVAASVALPKLAIDEWQAAADRLFGTSGAEAASGADPGYAPQAIALKVQDLVTGQRHLTHVSAGLSQVEGTWRASLDADQLAGYIEYRMPTRRAGASLIGGRVYARLARLSLPEEDEAQVESLLDQSPVNMPALDVVVDDFELHGKKLGRVEIEALNRATPQGPDWQLSTFNITLPEAKLAATGHWAAVGPAPRGGAAPRRALMDFKLQIADSGKLLERLGSPGAIKGGKGQLSGQVGWVGSPFTLNYASLFGQINVAVDAGQFLKVDPGAARLLGVLSLQSLPRRLSLDFRDLFQEGFAFDNITGDVAIANGVAKTNNLRMRGVQALVLMEGQADIEHETQDLRVVVVPELNAGTAALAYAVINPAIGLGAFLAQALLKKPLTEAGTREFHVSGPWADPKVERVAHKTGDDAPVANGK